MMKLQAETPARLVDITRLGLDKTKALPDGGVRIGAIVRNDDLAADAGVRKEYAVLNRASLGGASGQLHKRPSPVATCCNTPAATTSTTTPGPAASDCPSRVARR